MPVPLWSQCTQTFTAPSTRIMDHVKNLKSSWTWQPTALKWPPQSLNLNPTDHLWHLVETGNVHCRHAADKSQLCCYKFRFYSPHMEVKGQYRVQGTGKWTLSLNYPGLPDHIKITRPMIHYLISVKLNNTQTNIMVAWCQQVWSVPSSCILLGGSWATSSLPH